MSFVTLSTPTALFLLSLFRLASLCFCLHDTSDSYVYFPETLIYRLLFSQFLLPFFSLPLIERICFSFEIDCTLTPWLYRFWQFLCYYELVRLPGFCSTLLFRACVLYTLFENRKDLLGTSEILMSCSSRAKPPMEPTLSHYCVHVLLPAVWIRTSASTYQLSQRSITLLPTFHRATAARYAPCVLRLNHIVTNMTSKNRY